MSERVRILHVEDDPGDANLVREVLSGDGLDCEIVRVEKREAYLDALAQCEFDLIICDYTLPSFRGGEALELAGKWPHIPFLFLSGTIGEERAVETLKNGATEYVLKDNLARLPAAVRRALREAREHAERRKAEDALRASEARYRRLFERNLAGVFRSTVDGRILECNHAFARIFGYDRPEELLGVRAAELFLAASERDALLERIRTERTLIGLEVCFRRKDGTLVWALENVTLLGPETGEDGVLEGTMVDITERKNLEEQFRQAQKMEAVGRLAGGVAHDFNNILTVILGSSDLLGAGLSIASPLREEVEEIRKAAGRAAALTRQLLAFSRRQVLMTEVLDLNALVRNIERMLRRVLGEDIEIRTAYDPELGRVRADRGQLEQVLMNLVVNARDAMPSGGTLTIETRNTVIDEAHAGEYDGVRPGPAVRLSVRDTGGGMDPETQLHIFEPFYTTKEKGTGLGLATVYGIVQQSGGHIAVSSEEGKGATFTIFLPRVDGSEGPVP
jgi:two-component system cell cycle sensor histidine kinase/response regulator CckA